MVIDALQYCLWSRKIFEEMRGGGVIAVHATLAYHEGFRETVDRLVEWNTRFRDYADLILFAQSGEDIERARASGRTAIFLGLQNASPIDGDLGLVEILHGLGIRFMQLSYNNQSLLCSGWMEPNDTGVTRMGREIIREMNRVGMLIDMSHSGERSTLDAIHLSERPIVVTHANPASWHATGRNKSDAVLETLAASGGIIGLSLYPNHMRSGSETTVSEFTTMVAGLADRIGVDHIGIGSDLCQDQPASALAWMRQGHWMRRSTAPADAPAFPPQPVWFRSNLDFTNLRTGLREAGFTAEDGDKILYGNWLRFLRDALPAARQEPFAMEAADRAMPTRAGRAGHG